MPALPRFCGAVALATLLSLASPTRAAPAGVRRAEPKPELARAAARAGVRPEVLGVALRAYARAAHDNLVRRPLLTLIDYSLPSRERRLWVLDLARDRVLAHEFVAHGRGSGGDLPDRFSNRAGSLASSLGTFIAGATYLGRHGLSLRLRGLDPGLNDAAESRGVVMHGAGYVDSSLVASLGRLGRSQGCPALAPAAAARVIRLIADGTVLFAYYPSPALERALRP